MRNCFQLAGLAVRRTFRFNGRARRSELLSYAVLAQVPLLLLAIPLRAFASDAVVEPALLGLSWLPLLPLPALVTRRLRDIGLPPAFGLLLLTLVLRALGLDVLALGANGARELLEKVLSYVDWLLALPAFSLAMLLVALPSRKEGPETQTADAGETAPAG